jgi:hypothetical protein
MAIPTILRVLAFALPITGCGAAPVFRDQPVVWAVNDQASIAEPSERKYQAKVYFARIFAIDGLDRLLQLRDEEPAWNTNALDEVPNSTWFQNRIGTRTVMPAEASRGSGGAGPPEPPIRIVRSKVGGGNPGFIVADKRDRTFLVKFDTRENPEMQTSAGVVVNRIFWTLGYNVPSDHVFVFDRADLSIDPRATHEDELLREKRLGWDTVEAVLSTSPRRADGSYRAFASEFLVGKPKGGWAPQGVRGDDPNDVVPHEHRRELRGLRVFAAWVGHTDMKEDNTLDMYVEENGKHFLKHYLLDFGEALDAHAAEKDRLEDGFEYFIDYEAQLKATFAFGLWKRPWESRRPTAWASIGSFSAHPFDPWKWREAYPYWPFFEMDAADAYWAAKLVMRFDRPMLQAIVSQGQLSEPGAAAYLADTLFARRTAIGHAFLETVTPLDSFTARDSALCMIDLGVGYGLATSGAVERLSENGVVESQAVDRSGRVCLALPPHDGYTKYRLRTRRGGQTRPPLEVHLVGGSRPRVLGVLRVVE